MTDMDNISSLAEEVLSIVHHLPDKAIEKMISAWEDGKKIDKYNITSITGISGQKADRLSRMLETHDDQKIISSMFATGLLSKSKSMEKENEIEIVWTGPSLHTEMDVRNTKPVIEELLKSAERKVTIVDYMITSKAKSIVDELNKCLKEGVKVDLIIDKNDDNDREIWKCFSSIGLTQPRIFKHYAKESKYYKVHAKVLIIDDVKMLIGSANLTELGTEVNFELGVLVTGPLVKTMLKLLNEMVEDKYFEEKPKDE